MRNLKRALSLALASVILLGMMVVGAGAAQSYPDVDDSYNTEAIDVLKTVNVMTGYAEDGNFHPDDTVNRAMMARIMAELMNLDYDYYEAIPSQFTDVTGNYSWAKKYVDACAANGIVVGRGAGIYDPAAGVTAVEAASMMMRALGYFQHSGDYNGGFEAATVSQATKVDVGLPTDAYTENTTEARNAGGNDPFKFNATKLADAEGAKITKITGISNFDELTSDKLTIAAGEIDLDGVKPVGDEKIVITIDPGEDFTETFEMEKFEKAAKDLATTAFTVSDEKTKITIDKMEDLEKDSEVYVAVKATNDDGIVIPPKKYGGGPETSPYI